MGIDASVLDRSVGDLARLVQSGEVSAVEVTRAAIDRIEARDPALGAFLTVQADEAIAAARAVDDKRARGEALGKLAGVPIGLKDALCTRDAPTSGDTAQTTARSHSSLARLCAAIARAAIEDAVPASTAMCPP